MSASLNHSGHRSGGHDASPQEAARDSYKVKRKLSEPTLCPGCGAVFTEGRWQWRELSNAHEALCPACHRQQDNFPAGFLSIDGDFAVAHEAEIMGMVYAHEQREKVKHPLKRVMNIEQQPGGFLVTTTDAQLARVIGEALHQAYHGNLDFIAGSQENLLRVHWKS